MLKTVLEEMVKPMFRRAGTAVGTYCVAYTTIADLPQIESAVVLLLGILWDLAWSHLNRRGF